MFSDCSAVPGVSAALGGTTGINDCMKFQLIGVMNYSGYLIFQVTSHPYKGVDRKLFEPILIDGELDPECLTGEKIWEFYPAGWKRNAYKLYEENCFGNESISIVRDEETAALLLDTINKRCCSGCFRSFGRNNPELLISRSI